MGELAAVPSGRASGLGWAELNHAVSTGEGDLARANAKNGERRSRVGKNPGGRSIYRTEGGGRPAAESCTPFSTSEATGRSKR